MLMEHAGLQATAAHHGSPRCSLNPASLAVTLRQLVAAGHTVVSAPGDRHSSAPVPQPQEGTWHGRQGFCRAQGRAAPTPPPPPPPRARAQAVIERAPDVAKATGQPHVLGGVVSPAQPDYLYGPEADEGAGGGGGAEEASTGGPIMGESGGRGWRGGRWRLDKRRSLRWLPSLWPLVVPCLGAVGAVSAMAHVTTHAPCHAWHQYTHQHHPANARRVGVVVGRDRVCARPAAPHAGGAGQPVAGGRVGGHRRARAGAAAAAAQAAGHAGGYQTVACVHAAAALFYCVGVSGTAHVRSELAAAPAAAVPRARHTPLPRPPPQPLRGSPVEREFELRARAVLGRGPAYRNAVRTYTAPDAAVGFRQQALLMLGPEGDGAEGDEAAAAAPQVRDGQNLCACVHLLQMRPRASASNPWQALVPRMSY